jgi:hypothetical protein
MTKICRWIAELPAGSREPYHWPRNTAIGAGAGLTMFVVSWRPHRRAHPAPQYPWALFVVCAMWVV